MIPSNEFTTDPMLQPSMDVMFYNYLKFYNLTLCKCGKEFYQRKDVEQRDKCGVCEREWK